MKDVVADSKLVAYCGLYCGACGSYRKGKCPGCHENAKATWCKVRSCNMENKYGTCADCKEYSNAKDCKKLNNIVSKVFSLLFKSDRNACIAQIKAVGIDNYAKEMADKKLPSIKS